MSTITTSRPATMDELQAEIDRLHEGHARIYDEAQRLRTQLLDVNRAAHSLASMLCGVGVVAEKEGHELIRRESVMGLVTRWRMQWDAAMKSHDEAPLTMEDRVHRELDGVRPAHSVKA